MGERQERWQNRVGRRGRPARWFVLAFLALWLVAYHVMSVAKYGCAVLGGRMHYLAHDDIMISMCYARNLAEGKGWVLNAGERVEGFTNPLWTLIMAGLHRLPVPERIIPAGLHLINLCLSIGILWLLVFGRKWRPGVPGWAGVVSGLLYVVLPLHAVYAHEGFCIYLLAFVALYTLVREEPHNVASALLAGLLPLIHAVGMPLLAGCVLVMLWDARTSVRGRILTGLVAALPLCGFTAFRYAYFGEWLPNTFWLKVGGDGGWERGLTYVQQWAASVWPLLFLGVLGVIASERQTVRRIALAGCVYVVGIAAIGGDIFSQFRFLAPMTVLVCCAGGHVMAALCETAGGLPSYAARNRLLAICMVLMCAHVGMAGFAVKSSLWPMHVAREWNVRRLVLGQAIERNTPEGRLIGLFALGYQAYYGKRPVIDMLGKADKHIARQKPTGGRAVGHNKTDFDYVFGRQPYLVECQEDYVPFRLMDTEFVEGQRRINPFGYSADMAAHPAFRAGYLPNPVMDGQGRYLPFYAREQGGRWGDCDEYFTRLPPETGDIVLRNRGQADNGPEGSPVNGTPGGGGRR